jgi:hypothetical protein
LYIKSFDTRHWLFKKKHFVILLQLEMYAMTVSLFTEPCHLLQPLVQLEKVAYVHSIQILSPAKTAFIKQRILKWILIFFLNIYTNLI